MKSCSYENTKTSMDQRGTPEGRSTARNSWQLLPRIVGGGPLLLQPDPAEKPLFHEKLLLKNCAES